MIPAERQQFILTCLAERQIVSIADLVDRLGVSHMTVRRDIQVLEDAGRVASVTGGVQLARRLARELPHLQKAALNMTQKRAVSHSAAALVRDGMVIYLDAGTTMLELARLIADRRDLTVVTNDLVICGWLSDHSACTLYHTGGLVERANRSCLGDAAAQALARFNTDIAFISTSSWTEAGLSSPSEAKAAIKRVAVRQARRAVLVSDATKYGAVAAVNILPLQVLDTIITDDRIDPEVAHALQQTVARIILAPTDPIRTDSA